MRARTVWWPYPQVGKDCGVQVEVFGLGIITWAANSLGQEEGLSDEYGGCL